MIKKRIKRNYYFMNGLIITVMFAICSSFSSTVLFGDIIPPNSHKLKRCVKVVNLDEYPEIVLIGYYTGPMVNGHKTYRIEADKCLTKGYKHNKFNIYWNIKGEIDNIDPKKILVEKLETYGGYIDKSDPLITENIQYSLTETSDIKNVKYVLYKSKVSSTYNDGSLDKVEVFENPFPDKTKKNNLEIEDDEEEDSFWDSFFNFFGG